MTTARTSIARRSFRGIAVAAIAGAGIALSPLPASAAAGDVTGAAVDTALAQVGDPYVYGATGPNSFDCSGLTSYAYKASGVSIPRTSKAQSTFGTAVAKSDLKPGDLVFFYSPVSHVGMYIGNGQMVHASTAGKPVAVVSLDSMPSYSGARRVA
jgi:cell wall-associated NlpC family hydrolase